MIPPLVATHRFRPVALVREERSSGFRAPFAAVEATPSAVGTATLSLVSGQARLSCVYDAERGRVHLEVVDGRGRATLHRSRRHGRLVEPPTAVALTLTGRWLTAWSRSGEEDWTARTRVRVTDRVEVRDPAFLRELTVAAPVGVTAWRGGTFGQLGLRDLHLVTHADGSAYVRDGRHWVTATHAGPGFADTAHTGVWSWLPGTDDLRPEGLLWWERGGLVHGDHAVHVVRDDETGRWLVLASTWGDFDRTRVAITMAATGDDVLTGEHVLTGCEVALPPPPGPHVAEWDPHLTRIDGSWHLAWVAARKFFDFRPALARAASLDGPWELVGVADDRTATEGCVIVDTDAGWRLLASDGPEGPRRFRRRYPAYDLTMRETGEVDAPYGTNIPWPNVVRTDAGWSMLTFDGTEYGGRLPGYGTHGDVIVLTERQNARQPSA